MRKEGSRMRRQIAAEAARLLADQGDFDFARARARAAQSLGVSRRDGLPDNGEIAEALADYLAFYSCGRQAELLRDQRQAAIGAMRALESMQPRLVGALRHGLAASGMPIRLHLHLDYPEQLDMQLLELGASWRASQCNLRFPDGTRRSFPSVRMLAGAHDLELVCLGPSQLRNPPLDEISQKSERGLSLKQLEMAEI